MYLQVGDGFAYASVAGLLLLTGSAIRLRQRRRQGLSVAAAGREPVTTGDAQNDGFGARLDVD